VNTSTYGGVGIKKNSESPHAMLGGRGVEKLKTALEGCSVGIRWASATHTDRGDAKGGVGSEIVNHLVLGRKISTPSDWVRERRAKTQPCLRNLERRGSGPVGGCWFSEENVSCRVLREIFFGKKDCSGAISAPVKSPPAQQKPEGRYSSGCQGSEKNNKGLLGK